MAEKIGHVTKARYERIVAEGRQLVEEKTQAQFKIGDLALQLEPMNGHGGHVDAGAGAGVAEVMAEFAADIGLSAHTVETYRWISSRWPKSRRKRGVSHTVHGILANIHDDDERFRTIHTPPETMTHWTPDAARRVVGHTPTRPVTFQEKVDRVHDLARDDAVAAAVTGDLLRRPEVASRTMADPTVRHQVNRAQRDLDQQTRHYVREQAPVIGRVEHAAGFIDAIGACHVFIAGADRAVATLDIEQLTDEDRITLARNIALVHEAADRLAEVLHSGPEDFDQGLARLLAGEGDRS